MYMFTSIRREPRRSSQRISRIVEDLQLELLYLETTRNIRFDEV